jgi:hypothetical protein
MRKMTVFFSLLLLAAATQHRALAQDSGATQKPQEAAKPAEPPTHFYRLDLSLEQVDADGKPINSRSYTITISTARGDAPSEIRTGARVPISVGSDKEGENSQWQYQDLGVNIDARNPRDVGGKLSLYLAADVNSFAESKDAATKYHPTLNQNKWQGQVLIPIGKATVVFSSDEMQSKGAMRLVVTATLLQ